MSDELHVVFGTGPVGRAVIRVLLAGGKRVRAVDRSGNAALPDGVEPLAGDATVRHFTREACIGASVVYQCLNAPYHRWPELFPRLQAGVLEGAASAEAKLVSMENVYAYGPARNQALTEKRLMTATTRKGAVRARMADALMNAHEKGRVRVAIGRASDFFGPEVLISAMGNQVFGAAVRGRPASVLGNVDRMHTYTYMPDIAEALVLLGERDEALGEAWHLPSPDTMTTRQFLEMVYQEAGHPLKFRRAGRSMVRMRGLINRDMRELVEMMYQFEGSHLVDHGKFTAAFGDLATPLPEAIRATVEWYRQRVGAGVQRET